MTMFHKSWTWRYQTNNVGACTTHGWTGPNMRNSDSLITQGVRCVLRPEIVAYT